MRAVRRVLSSGVLVLWAAAAGAAGGDYRARLPQDESIYFLLPDRFENGDTSNDLGGLAGDRLHTGFDPTSKGFYHGGDIRGLIAKLDYIQALGVSAVWLGPIYKNKAVQGRPGQESSGYHGYWITDFTRVDPHFGSNDDMLALAKAVHVRGMKLYLDIVVNHTANVIKYRECPNDDCKYRSRADYPFTRHGGVNGEPINDGFLGDDAAHQTPANFAKLKRADYAYTPYIPAGEDHVKVPEWLNDPIYYHNRGDSTFRDESSQTGDFSGLDDLMTENPRVIQGFIDIFGAWIERYDIDGFRIDTAKHVNPEFWQKFVPAMLQRARARGIPHFHIFGEVAPGDAGGLQQIHTRVDKLPAVLDFDFGIAVHQALLMKKGTNVLANMFAADSLYEGGEAAAMQLPTFISNHDVGRFAYFAHTLLPDASNDEIMQREELANAMLFTLRGVPTIYYGDEQGFSGVGGDQASRQDMFASKVESYNNEKLLGSTSTTALSNFNTQHPLFLEIATLAKLRQQQPALRRGRQLVRFASEQPGLFAVSRLDPQDGHEVVIAFNTGSEALDAQVLVDARSLHFKSLYGDCGATASAPGSYRVQLAPLGFVVCAATEALSAPVAKLTVAKPKDAQQ